jgi:protein-tyrosine-phosphatase
MVLVMLKKKRRYGLGIWLLGLGFYLFYTPYSGFTKALSNGLLPGMNGPVRGTVLLPLSAIATVVGMLGFITVMGWWKYAGRREFFGVSVPFPRRLTFLSGVCMATIMGTTTLAFTFGGLSIVLVLVVLRGGTLIIAPVVDAIVGRRVRWFSWAAMFISLMAVLFVLGDASNYKLSVAAIVDIAAYLAAYFFKLQFMSRLAKSGERESTLRYFVEEQMVASPLLVLVLAAMALIGAGDVMMGFRVGFTSFLGSTGAIFAALVGLFYAALCICTSLIFLDPRENTFCMPMHCGSSMLSGFTASYALSLLFNQSVPSVAQLMSAGLVVIALGFLSPLHHFRRVIGQLNQALAKAYRTLLNVANGTWPQRIDSPTAQPLAAASGVSDQAPVDKSRRIFLFVCSGNTCRSPMAAAISNAEIAARFKIPFEALDTVNVRALSAGVAAKVGAPMTPEAQQVLRSLNVPFGPHAARNLTVELAHQAEMIFCLTGGQRQAVIDMIPSVAGKTHCLEPNGDIEDPMGKGLSAYLNCVQHIRSLVQLRFNEMSFQGEL